jgi:hypothetical protein
VHPPTFMDVFWASAIERLAENRKILGSPDSGCSDQRVL